MLVETKTKGCVEISNDRLISIPSGLFGFEEIDDNELLKIGIKDPADVMVLTIVTVPDDGSAVTANFQGPLIINKKNHQCMQAILDGSKYTTKHNILEALKRKEAK